MHAWSVLVVFLLSVPVLPLKSPCVCTAAACASDSQRGLAAQCACCLCHNFLAYYHMCAVSSCHLLVTFLVTTICARCVDTEHEPHGNLQCVHAAAVCASAGQYKFCGNIYAVCAILRSLLTVLMGGLSG
jgi:hypothetical protein